jgi:hypothetical protein
MKDAIIVRTKRIKDKKFWFSTHAFQSSYNHQWSNCLYLHFAKEDFPLIKSPELVPSTWGPKQRFDYDNSPLRALEFHGGITFYEETLVVETGRTIVKVGCDYQHYMDDAYQVCDHGEILLKGEAEFLAEEFEKFYQQLEQTALSKGVI